MRTPRILLAEDNPVNRKIALQMLDDLGYLADAVADGREAVEAVAQREYDLVLMDARMPRMGGFEAALQMRRMEGARRHIPIIAMLTGDGELCLESGMDDYLIKPLHRKELSDALVRWLPLTPGLLRDLTGA